MLINKCHLKLQDREATDFMLKVAEYNSKITLGEIKEWINKNCIRIDEKILENYLNKTALHLMLGDDENGE